MKDKGNDGQERPKTLTLNTEYYQSFLDDVDICDTKKQELIESLWSIVVSFVDLGFDIHPVQQAIADANTEHDDCLPAIRKMIEDSANSDLAPLSASPLMEVWPERSNT